MIALSLLTALAFGVGDFCGGLAAKRTTLLRVVGFAHIIGFFGVLIAALVIGNVLLWEDVALGAVGGAFGGIGAALLYRGLARGPMSVVAPVTAISSAVFPALWGLARGDRPSALAAVGLVVALSAIWMVSASDDEDGLGVDESAVGRPMLVVVAESLTAGAGFGMFFIFMDLTDPASSPWAVVGARALTGSLLGALLVVAAVRLRASGPNTADRPWGMATVSLIVVTGFLDTAANVLFLLAIGAGSFVVVAVLTSLYPVATIVLASTILNESLNGRQKVGLPLALASTALIAVG